MRKNWSTSAYGDERTSDANRRVAQALLRLMADSGQFPIQREKREYSIENAGMYIKAADNGHLSGPEVFWGAIRPAVNSDFRKRNAAEGKCGVWVFVSPTEHRDVGQCWFVPAYVVEKMLNHWTARCGSIQNQLTLHIRATGDGRFHLRGCGTSIDVTEWHLAFPVKADERSN